MDANKMEDNQLMKALIRGGHRQVVINKLHVVGVAMRIALVEHIRCYLLIIHEYILCKVCE